MSQSEVKEKASSQPSADSAAAEEIKSAELDTAAGTPSTKDTPSLADEKSAEAATAQEASAESDASESSSEPENNDATATSDETSSEDVKVSIQSPNVSDSMETLDIPDDGGIAPPPSSAVRNQTLVATASALQEEVADLKKKLQETRRAHLEEQLQSKRNADENKKLHTEIKQVAKEKDELYERLVRISADYDNLRKRSQREREESRKYGHEGLVKELLPMFDNFDLALKSMEDASAPASVVEGLQMLYKQYLDILHHHGVQRFEAKGQVFDYTLHEAISLVETDEFPDGTVCSEFRAGYKLHDRLLRPSMVAVAKAPAKPAEAASTEDAKAAEPAEDTPPSQDVASQADATSESAEESNASVETESKTDEATDSSTSS
ncbi:MAG: nucleotide exchange factor GrpE [Myxococcales bacterium]|nr:nucleotide exchange factor GrpE [Myxococcales bacterium]